MILPLALDLTIYLPDLLIVKLVIGLMAALLLVRLAIIVYKLIPFN